MQNTLDMFQEFHKNRRPNRILDWRHALGTAVLKAHFNKEWKELSVSLYQAVVLLLFSRGNANQDYTSIKTALGLGPSNVISD
jgi:cullin 4